MPAQSPTSMQDHGRDTTSVTGSHVSATSFCALADELIGIARNAASLSEAHDEITAILHSVHCIALQVGERRGIERGVEAACHTNKIILDELLGGK